MYKKVVVLIVEDDESMVELLKRFFEREELYIARTVAEARSLFTLHKERLDVIVLDGHLSRQTLPGVEHTSERLALDVRREGFKGLMLCTSSDPKLQQSLQEKGCNFSIEKNNRERYLKILDFVRERKASKI